MPFSYYEVSIVVKSISYSQDEILQNIIKLYIGKEDGCTFQVDPCYSKGNFYKKIPTPQFCFDIEPQLPFVKKCDCRHLPFGEETIESIIFDPPFLATKGPSLNKCDNNNHINKRFGVYSNEKELFQMYKDSIKEFNRILVDDGILVVKIQDKISSCTQYLSHVAIINFCNQLGLYCEDIFVLLAKSRLVADWQVKNQKHSRKFHSYFLVFRKNKKKCEKVLKEMCYNE